MATTEVSDPGSTWQFSPVETMHVPVEPQPPTAPEPVAPAYAPGSAAPAQAAELSRIGRAATPQSGPAIRVGDADRNKLVVGDCTDGAVVEQYRHLAAVLHHAQKASGVRSVMVTSAMASEGKTLTATNLALTLSESYQRRVLLVDADLRRPRMREMFALPAGPGLTDSLTITREGRLPVHQVTQQLWVLAAGHVVPDPMSMLASPAMKQLLDDARDSFDWVVVDTPPIAILPDANLLAAMIDTALLVVAADSTPYPMVQRAAQAIGPQRILGVVLNRAEKAGMPGYYYNGYAGYSRQAKPEPKRWLRWPAFARATARQAGSTADGASGQGHVQ
jgi:capsular exopolysaccharide synthesis family protein